MIPSSDTGRWDMKPMAGAIGARQREGSTTPLTVRGYINEKQTHIQNKQPQVWWLRGGDSSGGTVGSCKFDPQLLLAACRGVPELDTSS